MRPSPTPPRRPFRRHRRVFPQYLLLAALLLFLAALVAIAVPVVAEEATPVPDSAGEGPAPAGEDADPAVPDGDPEEGDEEAAAARFDEAIVVTATRGPRDPRDLPLSVSVLGTEQIETAPAVTTEDLLRNVAGLNLPSASLAVTNPLSSFVSMRGLGGARALVLFDGLPLNDGFFGYVPWDEVAPGDLERVEVVRGGASSLYGSYALGGTVNLISRPVTAGELAASVLAGSNETRRAHLRAAHRFGDRLGLSASAGWFDTDGYFRVPPAGRGANTVPARSESATLLLRAEGDLSPSLAWYARGRGFDQEGLAGNVLSPHTRDSRDLTLGSNWTGDDSTLEGRLFLRDGRFTTDNLGFDFVTFQEFKGDVHETGVDDAGASLVWRRLGRTTWMAGVDLRRIDGEDRGRVLDPAGDLVLRQVTGGTQDAAGLFAEGSFRPTPRTEILAGVRVDHWENRDGFGRLDPGPDERYADATATEVNPRLAVRWASGGGVALRAAAYRAFRAPNLDELYRSATLGSSRIVSNPRLQPEVLLGAEAGVDLALGPAWLQATVFHNQVEDEITFLATSVFPVFTLEVDNVGEGRAQGVELSARSPLGGGFTLEGAYTYTDATLTDNPTDRSLEGNRRPGVARHFASLDLTWRAEAGFTATLRGRHVGPRFLDGRNTREVPGYEVVDLALTWPLRGGLELVGMAENVLDEEYELSTFGPVLGAPRQVFGGIRWEW